MTGKQEAPGPLEDEVTRKAKYQEMAEHAQALLAQQQERFARVDEKASRQLSAATVVLGAAAFFGKWAIDDLTPPGGFIAWAILALGASCLLLTVYAFWKLLSVIRHELVESLPLSVEYLDFVRRYRRVDVHYYLASQSVKAFETLVEQTNAKVRNLGRGYGASRLAVVLLLPLTVFYGAHEWTANSNHPYSNEDPTMVSSNDTDGSGEKPEDSTPPEAQGSSEQPTTPADSGEPNTTIEGPKNIHLSEGADPDRIFTRVESPGDSSDG